ncbi:MAG: hypothetical protein ACSHYB_13735 [Roseibacillus sp.]
MKSLIPFLAIVALGLSACSSIDTPTTSDIPLIAPTTTLDVDVSVLIAKDLSKGWKQEWGESDDRQSFENRYKHESDPFEQLIIYGSTKPFPKLANPPLLTKPSTDGPSHDNPGIKIPQSWKSTKVMGKTVRYYKEDVPDGADGNYYSTEGFSLTDSYGKKGYYRLVIESVTGAAPARFSKVSWDY